MAYVLFSKDVWPTVNRYVQPVHIQVSQIIIEIEITDDRVRLAAAKDPLLHQRMVNTVQLLVENDLCQLLAYQIGIADAKAGEAKRAGNEARFRAAVSGVPQALDAVKQQIIPRIEAAATQVWLNLTRTRQEYRSYQIKTALKIGASVASIGVGIGSAVGTTGASLAVSIYGIAKGVADLLVTFRNAAQEAEGIEKRLQQAIRNARIVFEKAGRKQGVAWEVGRTFISKTLSSAVDIDTPSKCNELNELFGSKLDGLEVAAHSASEKLNTVLEKAEELGNVIRMSQISSPTLVSTSADLAAMKLRPIHPAPGRSQPQVDPAVVRQQHALAALEAEAHKLIQRISSENPPGLWKRVEGGRERKKEYDRAVAYLQGKLPTWTANLQKVVGFAIGTGLGVEDIGGALENAAFELVDAFGDKAVDLAVATYGRVTTRKPSGPKVQIGQRPGTPPPRPPAPMLQPRRPAPPPPRHTPPRYPPPPPPPRKP
ncbi:MAG: hypothetical protein ACM3ZB_03000 [bacterium]|jgi:hypothetical protein